MKKQEVIYYKDELNDEFSKAKITPRLVDENYKYIHKNPFWNICSFIMQNILLVPIRYLYPKLKFRQKFIGKEKLKDYKKKGYFIYANHTQAIADTILPSNLSFPKRNFYIVNPENISMKFLGNSVQMMGAIPISATKSGMKNFRKAVEKRIRKGYSISIYPEAHIWPYYTKIRPFRTVSFKYPIELNVPTFSITNTYQSYGRKNNKVQIITYVDGPFYANNELQSIKDKKLDLRNKVYNTMVERSKKSNIEYIKYIKE